MKTHISPDAPTKALLYILHSGQLFGTERMAITTLSHLVGTFDCTLLSPPGPAAEFARTAQVRAHTFDGKWALVRALASALRGRRELTLIATGLVQSLMAILLAFLFGVRLRHLHIVHGGADERLSYGRKKWLRWFPVEFIAVSKFVRERLLAHAVPAGRIHVIENFLADAPPVLRMPFVSGVQRAIVVSRLDPIKHIALLLDALHGHATLARLHVEIYGTGAQERVLAARAAQWGLNVHFAGFSHGIGAHLACSDLLVHTCAEEPFGLAIIEAMAAGIPVLVPDTGGPASYICDGQNGFTYRANDAAHLAARLDEIGRFGAERINQIVAAGRATLGQRFSPAERVADYRNLLNGRAP